MKFAHISDTHIKNLKYHYEYRVIFEQPFDQPELVVGVNDLEVLRQAGILPVGAQQPVGNGVEGADPHVAHGNAQQRF